MSLKKDQSLDSNYDIIQMLQKSPIIEKNDDEIEKENKKSTTINSFMQNRIRNRLFSKFKIPKKSVKKDRVLIIDNHSEESELYKSNLKKDDSISPIVAKNVCLIQESPFFIHKVSLKLIY
jgi:hypothetical protein